MTGDGPRQRVSFSRLWVPDRWKPVETLLLMALQIPASGERRRGLLATRGFNQETKAATANLIKTDRYWTQTSAMHRGGFRFVPPPQAESLPVSADASCWLPKSYFASQRWFGG